MIHEEKRLFSKRTDMPKRCCFNAAVLYFYQVLIYNPVRITKVTCAGRLSMDGRSAFFIQQFPGMKVVSSKKDGRTSFRAKVSTAKSSIPLSVSDIKITDAQNFVKDSRNDKDRPCVSEAPHA